MQCYCLLAQTGAKLNVRQMSRKYTGTMQFGIGVEVDD